MYKSQNKVKNTGFYIALAICIVTIAAAAWTTYGSVIEYYRPEDTHTGNEVSGEPYETSQPAERSEWSVPEASVPEVSVSEPAQVSASEVPVVSQPEEVPEPSEVSEPSEDKTESDVSEDDESVPTWVCPIENGSVLKPFSMTTLLFARTTNDWRAHRGTDYAAKQGTAVLAMADGVVQSVYRDALYGEVVCIGHDGCTARYCGLTEKSLVKEGDHVQAGQPIGYVGMVPCEQYDDPHLHLEILADDKYIDQEQLFRK